MQQRVLSLRGETMSRKTTLGLASILVVGVAAPASSTTIHIPPIVNIFLPNVFASTVGTSTDGANFIDIDTVGPVAGADGAKAGTLGSFNEGSADASMPTPTIFAVSTSASAVAGAGQTAAVVSVAKSGALLKFSVEFHGLINFKIDPPFMLGEGSAQDEMSFTALLNGSTIFSADAMLNDGSLITSGFFAPADFTVESAGGETVAQLTNDTFSASFDIPSSEVGQAMAFEFDQTFTANSQNGGTAEISNVPEPSSFLLFLTAWGAMGILLHHRKRMPQ